MTGTTHERLRDATTALGQSIQDVDIPPLRLPERGRRAGTGRGWLPRAAGRRLAARSWLIPAGAAAAVLAVIGLIFAAGGTGGGRPAAPPPLPAGLPRYLVTYGNGRSFVPGGGPGYVRDTATGRVVAPIPSAGRDFTVEGLAAAPGDRTFYLVGEDSSADANGLVKIECFRVVLGTDGRPSAPQRLPGAPLLARLPPSSNGAASIPLAVSPDGRELAYSPEALMATDITTAGPTTQSIVAQDVATGARRSWTAWPTSYLGINQVSWATRGRLAFVAGIDNAAITHGVVVKRRQSVLNVLMILNTRAPGSELLSASTLVSYGSWTADMFPQDGIPGPAAGLISPDGRNVYAQLLTLRKTSSLVTLSSVSGRVTRVLLSGAQAAPVSIDGHDLLFTLSVKHQPAFPGVAVYVSGHLAAVNLVTGRLVTLPLAIYNRGAGAATPMMMAW